MREDVSMLEINSPVLAMSVLLLVGYAGGRLARLVRLPAVAGYVLAGVLLGPSVLRVVPASLQQSMMPLKDFGGGWWRWSSGPSSCGGR